MITPERYAMDFWCLTHVEKTAVIGNSSSQRVNHIVLDSDQHYGQTLEFCSTVRTEPAHKE
jgi:hypothetical protein